MGEKAEAVRLEFGGGGERQRSFLIVGVFACVKQRYISGFRNTWKNSRLRTKSVDAPLEQKKCGSGKWPNRPY